jgi:hypothetical protein
MAQQRTHYVPSYSKKNSDGAIVQNSRVRDVFQPGLIMHCQKTKITNRGSCTGNSCETVVELIGPFRRACGRSRHKGKVREFILQPFRVLTGGYYGAGI